MNQQPDAAPSGGPTWRAVVIGVDEYPSVPEARLNGAVGDATAVRDFLLEGLDLPPDRVTFLTSPSADPATLASSTNIRRAFAALEADGAVAAGEHVILFYACHGVRLSRQGGGVDQRYYGLAPSDITRTPDGFGGLILDREINRLCRSLARRSVSVTVIADTCHSGASTRSLGDPTGERYLKGVAPLTDEQWSALTAAHPALAGQKGGGERAAGRLSENIDASTDFVVLAACQDGELAREVNAEVLDENGDRVTVKRGALTSSLLQALSAVPAAAVKTLRWMDLFDDLSAVVSRRVAATGAIVQRPALEGNPAQPVFGGRWRPFAPGFVVRQVGAGVVVDGGLVHGLDVGAELEVYPFDTADFEAAGPPAARLSIASAGLSTSAATLADGAALPGAKARARLSKPSPNSPPMAVRLVGVPDDVIAAARLDAPEIAPFVSVVSADALAHVELRPFEGEIPAAAWGTDVDGELTDAARPFAGASGGWALVRSEVQGAPSALPEGFVATPDDIIAYLPASVPGLGLDRVGATQLGAALREALIHYARFLRTRDRSGGDTSLRDMLSVRLRIGDPEHTPDAGATDLSADLIARTRIADPVDGAYVVHEGQWMFLEVGVLKATRLRLFAGVLVCSDDGNVFAPWPPTGQRYTFDNGSTTYIGEDRFNPLFLNRRRDQQVSRWTLKLVAYTAAPDSEPIDLHSLEQQSTAQDRISEALSTARAIIGRPPAKPELPAWYTFDFRILYQP